MTFVTEDVLYRTVDGVSLLGRLYRPEQASVLLIDVHGGAWTKNDRLNNAPIHRYLAERGIAVFALDFRMPQNHRHRYPAAVEDVNFGIRWAKANRERLGVAGRHIGGLGASSGGHLIALAALRPRDVRFCAQDAALAGHDAALDFVIACWPILDPLARYRMAQANGVQSLIEAHDAFWPDETAMREGNPQLMLEHDVPVSLPPMLILQGSADENVEHHRADLFAEHYRKAGGAVELCKFEGQPHTFITKDPASEASLAALARINSYIDDRLKG